MGETQSKAQEVDQLRGELGRCRAKMETYKQQAEQHEQQTKGRCLQCEQMSHTMTALQEENQRLKEEIHLLQHTAQHSQGQVQGGREGSPINVEEVIKVLRKYEEVVRTFGDKEVKLEETTPQNVPKPVRPQHQNPPKNQHLNHQTKSTSVDSANDLSFCGYIDLAQYQSPIPSVTVANAIPRPPPTTRPEETAHHDQRYSQVPLKQHTSIPPSPQQDLAAAPSLLGGVRVSNTNTQPPTRGGVGGRGYPYPSVGHGGSANSPTGDGNENTLEKGIDGDIRRAARNIKKQMAGREPSVGGGGGVEAPYDPNQVNQTVIEKSNSQSNSESETSPFVYSGDSGYKEGRTTHLEKRLDKVLLHMQAIEDENKTLRDEVYQMKKQPGAAVTSSHKLREDVLVNVDSQEHQKKVPPALGLNLWSQSPAATGNRSRSPSPVAVVTPVFRSPKPQSPYRRQASVGPVVAEALPLAQPITPPLPQGRYNQQQQQRLEIGGNPQAVDNFGTPRNGESDDRPFDPNLVCPKCKQQFRIGEIQEYKKHYKLCHSENKKKDLNSIGLNMAGDTQPFTPIFPTAGCQNGLNEDVQTVKPKLLCRTPGCSFKPYEDLGGLCPDCSGSR